MSPFLGSDFNSSFLLDFGDIVGWCLRFDIGRSRTAKLISSARKFWQGDRLEVPLLVVLGSDPESVCNKLRPLIVTGKFNSGPGGGGRLRWTKGWEFSSTKSNLLVEPNG